MLLSRRCGDFPDTNAGKSLIESAADLQNHVDYVSESLTELGDILCYDRFPVWMNTFRVSCKQNSGSLMLLKNTLAVMDRLVSELPMCLYASAQTRRLRAYVDFLSAREMSIPSSRTYGNRTTATSKFVSSVYKREKGCHCGSLFGTMSVLAINACIMQYV